MKHHLAGALGRLILRRSIARQPVAEEPAGQPLIRPTLAAGRTRWPNYHALGFAGPEDAEGRN